MQRIQMEKGDMSEGGGNDEMRGAEDDDGHRGALEMDDLEV